MSEDDSPWIDNADVVPEPDRFETALEILSSLIRHYGTSTGLVRIAWTMTDDFFTEWEARETK